MSMNGADYIDKCEAWATQVIKSNKEVSDGYGPPNLPYNISQTIAYARALLALSPLQPGDRAALVDPPEILPDSGWYSYKNLFTPGAIVTIKALDYYDGKHVVMVEFAGGDAIFPGLNVNRFRKLAEPMELSHQEPTAEDIHTWFDLDLIER